LFGLKRLILNRLFSLGSQNNFTFFTVRQPLVGLGLLVIEVPRSHSDTPHSVELLWTIDRPVAETSDNKQHLTRDKHPWPRRD